MDILSTREDRWITNEVLQYNLIFSHFHIIIEAFSSASLLIIISATIANYNFSEIGINSGVISKLKMEYIFS